MNGGLREIQDRLAQLSKDVETRRALIGRGEPVDLSDLETRIGDVCVEVVNARPQSACFLPSLKQLFTQLDELGEDLKQRQDMAG